jgi:O-antigen ligase
VNALVHPRLLGLLTGGCLLGACGAAAYWQQPLLLLLLPALLGGLLLVQHPTLLFYALMATIPWSVEFSFSDTLATDLPDEPLMLLAAGAALLVMVARRRQWRMALHPLLLLLALQLLWTGAAVLTSGMPLLSWKYALAKGWYVLAFVVLPCWLFRKQEVMVKGARILVASMGVFTLYALVRHGLEGWRFDSINRALEPFYRNHVNYSSLLVLMVPLQLALLRFARGRKRSLLRMLLVLTLAALILSYARGAWVALLAGGAAWWLLRRKLLVAAFIAGWLLLLSALYWLQHNDRYVAFSHDYNTTVFHTDFSEHLVATYQLRDVSTAERYYRWIAGLRMVPDGEPTGFGPSTFYHYYRSYTVPAFKTWVSRNEERSTVHNYFLLLAIEQGITGCLLFLLLLGALFWQAQRSYHRSPDPFRRTVAAAVAAMLAMITVVNLLSDLIETDKVGPLFYLCLVALVVIDRPAEKGEVG